MKKLIFTILILLSMGTVAGNAAEPMGWRGLTPNEKEARLNRDGYPYTVMNRVILEPQEKEKLRRNLIRYEQYQKAREQNMAAQFRAMSATERRYVIQTQGFPRGVYPGYK